MKNKQIAVPVIENKIFVIRGLKVMLDSDLAQMYGVSTAFLNRSVRRNNDRFPADFAFLLSKEETENLKCQFGTSSWGGRRKLPFVFTELGVAMLSSVLNSKRAIQTNIQIMRVFTHLKNFNSSYHELKKEIQSMRETYDKSFAVVFDAIGRLLDGPKNKFKVKGFIRL